MKKRHFMLPYRLAPLTLLWPLLAPVGAAQASVTPITVPPPSSLSAPILSAPAPVVPSSRVVPQTQETQAQFQMQAQPLAPVLGPVLAPILPDLPTLPTTLPITLPPAQPIPLQPAPAQPTPTPAKTVPVQAVPIPIQNIPTSPIVSPPVIKPPVLTPPVTTPPVTTPPIITSPITTPPVETPPVLTPPTVRNAVRGLWVDGFGPGLKTRAQVTQMVSDAQRLGVNTLFVQAIRRADCLCSRASVPRVSDHDLEVGFDPLDEAIKLAHAHNIRVIAWVSVTGAGSANAPSTNPLHVLAKHGPAASPAQSWVNRRLDGSYLEGGDIWLDAGIPAASDFMSQSIISLVKNYAVDGIQFDRIRYPDGGNWGYSPVALSRYRAETGARATPLPSDPQWAAWKRQQITALVRRVALEARILRPNIWVTAATITYGAPPTDLSAFQKSRTYNDVYQDWPEWNRLGLLDLNVLMNYKQDLLPNHIAWFNGWNAFALKVAGRADVAAGTALYLNTPEISRAQLTRTLESGLGWVGYAYRTPNVDVYKGLATLPQGLEQLHKALSGDSGPLRPSLWQSAPPPRYGVLGRLRGLNPGGRLIDVYDASGNLLGSAQSDGNGYYGFADLPAGKVEVRVAGQRWPAELLKPGVQRLPDLLLREVNIVAPVPSVSVKSVGNALPTHPPKK